MWDKKKSLKNIKSYIDLMYEHSEKIDKAFWSWDKWLLIYYKKETNNFIINTEKIFEDLNNHEDVLKIKIEFLESKNIIINKLKSYWIEYE